MDAVNAFNMEVNLVKFVLNKTDLWLALSC